MRLLHPWQADSFVHLFIHLKNPADFAGLLLYEQATSQGDRCALAHEAGPLATAPIERGVRDEQATSQGDRRALAHEASPLATAPIEHKVRDEQVELPD